MAQKKTKPVIMKDTQNITTALFFWATANEADRVSNQGDRKEIRFTTTDHLRGYFQTSVITSLG